jgi:Holliday junction resolvase RusA-like endonuclease
MTSLRIEIPLVPPTVNHYKKPAIIRRRGQPPVKGQVLTAEAKAYKAAVAIFAHGETLAPAKESERRKTKYMLQATVYLGHNQRGDGDNFWKCLADGLVEAGVIHSDAAVTKWHIDVARDRANPRTVVEIFIL